MGRNDLVSALGAVRIALDTSTLLYLLRGDSARGPLVSEIMGLAADGVLEIVISAIVKMELLVGPLRSRDEDELERVLTLTEGATGVFSPLLTPDAIAVAAEVRAKTNLRVPDALIVATATTEGCGAIVGNDRRMERIQAMDNVGTLVDLRQFTVPRFIQLDGLVQRMA